MHCRQVTLNVKLEPFTEQKLKGWSCISPKELSLRIWDKSTVILPTSFYSPGFLAEISIRQSEVSFFRYLPSALSYKRYVLKDKTSLKVALPSLTVTLSLVVLQNALLDELFQSTNILHWNLTEASVCKMCA